MKDIFQAERNLWRFGVGLGGSRATLAMALAALFYGYFVFVYLMLHPIHLVYGEAEPFVHLAAMIATTVFLGVEFAIIFVMRQRRERVQLRLLPYGGALITSLVVRLILLALICLMPVVALRALAALKYPAAVELMISFADVPMHGFLTSALTLAYLSVLIVVTFGWLRAPLRFAFLPIYWGQCIRVATPGNGFRS